jgi:transcriptional regulator with XRE-family HTH domain
MVRKMSGFGKIARRLREEKGLTTRMLAEELGVANSQVSRYENDINEPTLSILRKYSKIFGVTLDELCDEEKE